MRPALALAVLLLVGCSEPPMLVGQSPEPPPTQVIGLITELEYEGDQLVSMSIESRDDSHDILIDPEFDYGFNLKHLESHRTDELPVAVDIDARDDGLYAVGILDA